MGKTYIYAAPRNAITVAFAIHRETHKRLVRRAEDYAWDLHNFCRYIFLRGLEAFSEAPVTEAEVGVVHSYDDHFEKA